MNNKNLQKLLLSYISHFLLKESENKIWVLDSYNK